VEYVLETVAEHVPSCSFQDIEMVREHVQSMRTQERVMHDQEVSWDPGCAAHTRLEEHGSQYPGDVQRRILCSGQRIGV
jgi:hypothetical protein